MAETNTTILIPDISGFTEFMTSTELSHGTKAINMLIDAIVNAVGEEYEVSEIEGDAVLLIKKGPAPSRKEIQDTCLKIFNAFHFQRKFMEMYTICPCGACQAIINLSLKFVAHHGPLAEIKVGRFVKQSGTEMIVAHRLLKNSINNNEYLLVTEKLPENQDDLSSEHAWNWTKASEEYASLGKIGYSYALLNEARKNVPDPPRPDNHYQTDNTSFLQIEINAPFLDVYMTVMNIPNRAAWMPALERVDQDMPDVYIGTKHLCTFNDYKATISPLRMTFSDEGIMYAESCTIHEMDLSLVHEFVFKKLTDTTSVYATRFMSATESPIPEEVNVVLFERMQQMSQRLKEYCDKTQVIDPIVN